MLNCEINLGLKQSAAYGIAKQAMKFFSHIRVCTENYAGITFIVYRNSEKKFIASPVQNCFSGNSPYFPACTLIKVEGLWKYEFENNKNGCLTPF